MTNAVILYTDGSCLENPGPGGWAAILQWRDEERELSGGEADSTNNRMELQAAIEGLRALKRPMQVDLYTDSTYVMKGVTEWMPRWKVNGWRTAAKNLSRIRIYGRRLTLPLATMMYGGTGSRGMRETR